MSIIKTKGKVVDIVRKNDGSIIISLERTTGIYRYTYERGEDELKSDYDCLEIPFKDCKPLNPKSRLFEQCVTQSNLCMEDLGRKFFYRYEARMIHLGDILRVCVSYHFDRKQQVAVDNTVIFSETPRHETLDEVLERAASRYSDVLVPIHYSKGPDPYREELYPLFCNNSHF